MNNFFLYICPMKFLAPLLALIAVWLSAGPQGRYNCSKTSTYEKTSCHKAEKCSKKKTSRLYQSAHSPKETNDCCAGGVCNPFQVCVYCCFLPVDKVGLPEPLISVTKKEKTRLGYIRSVSHFSGDFFQPPERPV
jgi:hypothetical protein